MNNHTDEILSTSDATYYHIVRAVIYSCMGFSFRIYELAYRNLHVHVGLGYS